MTVGSTSLGEIFRPKLPKPSLRAAHTVVTNYCGPFNTFEWFDKFTMSGVIVMLLQYVQVVTRQLQLVDVLRIIKMSGGL
jgi:hypothetical protein